MLHSGDILSNHCRCSMCDSLTERDSVLHFSNECSRADIKVKRQKVCELVQYALRLDWLANIAFTDVCLFTNMVDEQTAMAILNIVCVIHDLRVSFLCYKRIVNYYPEGHEPSHLYALFMPTICIPPLNNYVTSYIFTSPCSLNVCLCMCKYDLLIFVHI